MHPRQISIRTGPTAPTNRTIVAMANAAAILLLALWGVVSHEWFLRVSGGQASLNEFATWVLIAVNAPGFLLSIVAVSPFHLGLESEYIVQHVLWAFATVPAWWILWTLGRPSGRTAQVAIQLFVAAATMAAIWTTHLALLQAHDPHHSCWQALELPIMLAALAVLGSLVGLRRTGAGASPSSS